MMKIIIMLDGENLTAQGLMNRPTEKELETANKIREFIEALPIEGERFSVVIDPKKLEP